MGRQSRDGRSGSSRDAYQNGGRYSRQNSQHYAAEQKRRKRKKTIIIVVSIVVALLLAGAGAAWAYFQNLENNLHSNISDDLAGVLNEQTEEEVVAGDPFYMLLLGSDNNEDREADGENSRTDSIILARIDPKNQTVTLISIQRDTLVDISGYGQDKINAAYVYGGQALTVETVENYAGVDISHYAEVDMDGFYAVIDQLGGIEVDVPETFYDEYLEAGLDEGYQTLNADQAMVLCRARHAFDDLGSGDVIRASHQRLVLSAVVKKILSSDVATMISTVSTLSQYVTTDMTTSDIVSLAKQMYGMDTDTGVYSGSNPTVATYTNDIWYEVTDTAAWTTMMKRVDQGLPPSEDDSASTDAAVAATSCSISVHNGSGIEGAGAVAQSRLVAAGMTVTSVETADTSDYVSTLVIYNKTSCADAAAAIATALGCGRAYYDVDSLYTVPGDILVLIGQDWV